MRRCPATVPPLLVVPPQYARAREVIPWSAMPDRKLVMPSFRIEMRDGSPQSRPAGWPAAGLRMPRLDHGPRDPDEAVLAEMRAVLDKMAMIQKVDVHLHRHPPRVGDRL
jgi:hypothetical protein